MKRTSRVILTTIIGLCFVLSIFTNSNALSKPTHKLINRYIAENTLNGFSLDSYLKGQLGLQNGKDNMFNNKKASQWISEGGAFEDEPFLRSVNHFHNPVTKQGFTDLNHWWALYGVFGLLNGQSSIQWSQNVVNKQWPGGYFSWHDARDYFYQALTSTDQATRAQNFANTFRSIGQGMHLVEDSSVPEHARNSFHGLPWNYIYEDYIEQDELQTFDVLSNFLQARPPIYFDPSAIGSPNPLGSVPVANLFDNNKYDGTNPNVTLQNNVGLSEYTNANFLCPGTMFTPDFNYPNWNSVILNPNPDPITGELYLTKLGQNDPPAPGGQIGNGEHIDHLAVSRWGYNRLPSSISLNGIFFRMDKQVYKDYAAKLIPRAVGYAAELLNYFFRGQIAMVNSQWTATSVTFKVMNNSPNEAMGPGRLVVSYEYSGSILGVSNEIQLSETIPAGSESSNEYTITFPQPIPSGSSTFWLVFRGKLGNEDDSVVAKSLGISPSGQFGCIGGVNGLFHTPPLEDGAGSFTTNGTFLWPDGPDFHFTIDCSYGSGNMSCDISTYYVNQEWNGGIPVFCGKDHCEGSWDGYSFYDVCTLVIQGQGVCYRDCDPIYMSIQTSNGGSSSTESSFASDVSKANNSCRMLRRH